MSILYKKDDFYWYIRTLDAKAKHQHQHNGEPEKYPCKVESDWWDDPNGPYTYDHTFTYQSEEECPNCGHKTKVWIEGDK